MQPARTSLLLAVLAIVLAGCGGSTASRSTTFTMADSGPTETTTRPVSPAPTSLVIYRLRDGTLQPERVHVPSTTGVAVAALGALNLGATVTVSDGTARVDRPQSTPGEVAEIVYTLTQFSTILRVDVAGRSGLARDAVSSFVAPILVERPIAGDTFDGRVTGTASVFEATLVVELRQDGQVLAKRTVSASEGAPARGSFVATLDTSGGTSGPAVVVAYSPSAADGSAQHKVEVPVRLP